MRFDLADPLAFCGREEGYGEGEEDQQRGVSAFGARQGSFLTFVGPVLLFPSEFALSSILTFPFPLALPF